MSCCLVKHVLVPYHRHPASQLPFWRPSVGHTPSYTQYPDAHIDPLLPATLTFWASLREPTNIRLRSRRSATFSLTAVHKKSDCPRTAADPDSLPLCRLMWAAAGDGVGWSLIIYGRLKPSVREQLAAGRTTNAMNLVSNLVSAKEDSPLRKRSHNPNPCICPSSQPLKCSSEVRRAIGHSSECTH